MVSPKLGREEALRAQGEELEEQAGAVPFLNAFSAGGGSPREEAEELKELIDRHTWEG